MKKQEKELKVQLKFNSIELLKNSLTQLEENKIQSSNFIFEISNETQLNEQKKILINLTSVTTFNEHKEFEIAHLLVRNTFLLDNFEEVITKDAEGKLRIPEAIVLMLNSICISTMRGIMWNTYRGTVLNNALLPIIDPSQLKRTDNLK